MLKLNNDILLLIFEELKHDLKSLYSCLLVNRQWCKTVVPILWKDPYIKTNLKIFSFDSKTFEKTIYYKKILFYIILFTLSNDSKEFFFKYKSYIKYLHLDQPKPLFDYLSYCKYLRYDLIIDCARCALYSREYDEQFILEQDLLKFYIKKCSSIKYLDIRSINNIDGTYRHMNHLLSEFPGSKNCFSNLCELHCNSNIDSYIFYKLSTICKFIQKINVTNLRYNDKNPGLIRLIEVQKNLKSFKYSIDDGRNNNNNILLDDENENFHQYNNNNNNNNNEIGKILLLKHSENLIQFKTKNDEFDAVGFLNTFSNFKNLEKLVLCKLKNNNLQKKLDKQLQISHFLKLKVLQIYKISLYTIKIIIENTDRNLTKISIFDSNYNKNFNDQLIKSIYLNCPNLKFLRLKLKDDLNEFENLLIKCQKLEGLVIESCSIEDTLMLNYYFIMDSKNLLELLAKSSPISLYKFKFYHTWEFTEDSLISFFESWKGRKPLFFYGVCNPFFAFDRFRDMFEKYLNEGIIKKYFDDKYNEYKCFEW